MSQETHELSIKTNDVQIKEMVKEYLSSIGVDTFVEGVADSLDVDLVAGGLTDEDFQNYGGGDSPLLLYSYDAPFLDHVSVKLQEVFPSSVILGRQSIPTDDWLYAWKDQFKPIETELFYIHPPWEKSEGNQKIALCINPGLAFGTGQHETTKLCLLQIEKLFQKNPRMAHLPGGDIGTGSGILAIALAKLGFQEVLATDIDQDAVLATKENAKVNEVELLTLLGSLPKEKNKFGVLVANILLDPLIAMLPDLFNLLSEKGHLIISGILCEQKEVFLQKAKQIGMELVGSSSLNGWQCLELQKIQ